MRERIYNIITDNCATDSHEAHVYDWWMITVILLSLVPLCFKEMPIEFVWLERATTLVFIVDYLLRWMCADLLGNGEKIAFVLYPFTPLAVIDLISMIPTFAHVSQVLRLSRLIRLLRVLRAVKLVHHSRSVQLVLRVLKNEREALLAVLMLAIGYVFISAMIIFNIEPETFGTFFDALYWAVISLTTIGYGDLYATSVGGRAVSMISAIMGIAVIALPSGIITAGFVKELRSAGGTEEQQELGAPMGKGQEWL